MSYTLDQLLTMSYNELKSTKKTDITIVSPTIVINNKKTYVTNFAQICKSIRRDSNLLINYINKMLSTKCSVSEEALRFDKLYPPIRVRETIGDFIRQYVQCQSCKSKDTIVKNINKENILICQNCKCERTISYIN